MNSKGKLWFNSYILQKMENKYINLLLKPKDMMKTSNTNKKNLTFIK